MKKKTENKLINLFAILLASLIIVAIILVLLYVPAIILHIALTGFGFAVSFGTTLATWGLLLIIYILFFKK